MDERNWWNPNFSTLGSPFGVVGILWVETAKGTPSLSISTIGLQKNILVCRTPKFRLFGSGSAHV